MGKIFPFPTTYTPPPTPLTIAFMDVEGRLHRFTGRQIDDDYEIHTQRLRELIEKHPGEDVLHIQASYIFGGEPTDYTIFADGYLMGALKCYQQDVEHYQAIKRLREEQEDH